MGLSRRRTEDQTTSFLNIGERSLHLLQLIERGLHHPLCRSSVPRGSFSSPPPRAPNPKTMWRTSSPCGCEWSPESVKPHFSSTRVQPLIVLGDPRVQGPIAHVAKELSDGFSGDPPAPELLVDSVADLSAAVLDPAHDVAGHPVVDGDRFRDDSLVTQDLLPVGTMRLAVPSRKAAMSVASGSSWCRKKIGRSSVTFRSPTPPRERGAT